MLIAITGGIGSGKTAVMNVLRDFNAQIISADEINSQLITENNYIMEVGNAFPSVIVDGKIDKVALSKIVFYNEKEMQKLNSLAHPRIIEEIKNQAKKLTGLVFVEIPLLVESKSSEMFDKIWLVVSGNELRLKRIVMRDLISEDFAKRIMATQATDKIRIKFATDIIENNGDTNILNQKVKKLYEALINC